MAHSNTGNYKAKHKAGKKISPRLVEAINRKVVNGEMACGQANRIAGSLRLDLKDVGTALDLMEIRITKCQLGFFGYGQDDKPLKPAKIIKTDMEEAIREALVDNRLTCRAAWDLAARFGVPKMRISSLCETLNIKITSCQLGAF
ncbi:MAG: hypothetical protein JW943_04160 [Deltaproteobacteria bacterium]|nr:hypothetical protein [Deltaproteobacteria bacterium]